MKSTRERILALVGQRPRTTRQLSRLLSLSVPAVGRQLARIRAEGPPLSWVQRREGKRGVTSKAWVLR